MLRSLLVSALALAAAAALPAAEDLYNPMAVGTRWEVAVDLLAPGAKLEHGTAVRVVTGTEEVKGQKYSVLVTHFEGISALRDFTILRRKAADGVYAIAGDDATRGEYLESVLPLAVGATWTLTRGEAVTVFKVEGQETVRIGERSYEKCFRVGYGCESLSLKGTYWVAPRVGNVKESLSQAGLVMEFRLRSFRAGGAEGKGKGN